MTEWVAQNGVLLGWLGVASLATVAGSVVVIPAAVARIPVDYFLHDRRSAAPWWESRLALRVLFLLLKNVLGLVFLCAGLVMLVLPGQGILTLLIGILLLDFPGKFALERRFVCNPTVLRALNWIRERAGRKPLLAPGCSTSHQTGNPKDPSSFQ